MVVMLDTVCIVHSSVCDFGCGVTVAFLQGSTSMNTLTKLAAFLAGVVAQCAVHCSVTFSFCCTVWCVVTVLVTVTS